MSSDSTQTLAATLVRAAAAGPVGSAPPDPNTITLIPLELLDANPRQPRRAMKKREVAELAASIKAVGLEQAIKVRPRTDGRFTIVYGHRRTEAFKALLEKAETPEERARFARIPAIQKLAMSDAEMAIEAYVENVQRANLSPLEDALALKAMLDAGEVSSASELATKTGQAVQRVQRLVRLASAPDVILTAMDPGIRITVAQPPVDGADDEGTELRSLEMRSALEFLAMYEHLRRAEARKPEERVEGAIRRALTQRWNLRRIEAYVQDVVKGRAVDVDGDDAEAAQGKPVAPVFQETPKRFTIDLSRLGRASPAQLTELKVAIERLIAKAGAIQAEA